MKFYKAVTDSLPALFLSVSTHPDVGCLDLLSDDYESVEYFCYQSRAAVSHESFSDTDQVV